MKTKIIKSGLASLLVAASWLFSGVAFADSISMSAGCPGDTDCDGGVADVYSFSLVIVGTTAGTGTDAYTVFTATLTNTTAGTGNDALIDNFWMSIVNGTATDPSFGGFNPNTWDVQYCDPNTNQGNPCNVEFLYAGDPDSSSDRLGPGSTLEWTMTFAGTEGVGFDVFTGAPQDNGVGGGNDLGQVCVSFQRLDGAAVANEESDQVCGDWGDTPEEVAEPGTLGLLGLGLLGIGVARRRRIKS